MKRFWLVTDGGQYAVYDSKEKTTTDWVNLNDDEFADNNYEATILALRNSLERHDEEIGDLEDHNGNPLVDVVAQTDLN